MLRTVICVSVVIAVLLSDPWPASACVAFGYPVDGPITAGFSPDGEYAGHWGVDFDTDVGTPIHAAESGTVTWAGLVVENLTVTIHHGGGLRSSYSYLSDVHVEAGQWVPRGAVVGSGSDDHLHFSVRIGSRYIDPLNVLTCVQGDISPGLRLVPVSYPAARATWHSRRYVRSAPSRSPAGR